MANSRSSRIRGPTFFFVHSHDLPGDVAADPKGLSSRLGVRTNQRVDHVGDSRLFLLGHRSTVVVANRPGFDAAVQDLSPSIFRFVTSGSAS